MVSRRGDGFIRSGITSILASTNLVGGSSSVTSSTFIALGYRDVSVHLFIDSSATPVTVQFVPQFSNDTAGTNYNDYREGIWSSMFFEDTVTSTGIRRIYSLPMASERLRFFVEANTSAGNFDVAIDVEGIN